MNLKKLKVVELNTQEVKKTEGGFLGFGPFNAGLTLAYRNWLLQTGTSTTDWKKVVGTV